MRTIKAQDGKMIVSAERALSFNVRDININNDWFIIADSWINEDSWCNIAKYSTEERALKVLDMLNEWLTSDKDILDIILNRLLKESDCVEILKIVNHYNCFQMPQDNEELD